MQVRFPHSFAVMANSHPLHVSIPGTRLEYSRIGIKTPVYLVQVNDSDIENLVEMDDLDFGYLHEQLSCLGDSAPKFPQFEFAVFNSDEVVEARRIGYERYLQDVIVSPSCVAQAILWVSLEICAEAAVVQRFICRHDNLAHLEELSARSEEHHRFANSAVVGALLRLMDDGSSQFSTVASSVSILTRILPTRDRLAIETNVLPTLVRILMRPRLDDRTVHEIRALCLMLVEANPHSLFVYFQRENGLTEIIDSLETQPDVPPSSVLAIATIVWTAVSQSRDVQICISDKSSVGMTLLNKLLVMERGGESELVVASILAFLFARGLVPEYGTKIVKIIGAAIGDYKPDFKLIFLDSIGSSVPPLLSSAEAAVVQLGCHLIVSKCIRLRQVGDADWWRRNAVAVPISERLAQIASAESLYGEATRMAAAEALVMMGEDSPPGLETKLRELMKKSISEKIHKLNNFFIEANFDLSSRSVGAFFTSGHWDDLTELFTSVGDVLSSARGRQRDLQAVHSSALTEIVSGMFQVKSLLRRIESVGAESVRDPDTSEREKDDDRKDAIATIQSINSDVITLSSNTVALLYRAVSKIDEESEDRAKSTSKLKSVLLKMRHSIDQLLDDIDVESGSSPISP